MPKVDLKLYSTDAAEGKKQTTTITYVNPNASNAVLKTFAQQLNQFTTNGYASADRVETVNVDTAEDAQQYRNITLENVSPNQQVYMEINVDKNQSIDPIIIYQSGNFTQITPTKNGYVDDKTADRVKFTFNIPNSKGTLFIGIPESDTFYSTFIKETVN